VKKTALLFFASSLCVFALEQNIQDIGVEVTVDGKKLTVKRDINETCLELDMNAKNAWSGDFTAPSVPKECKKSFINSFGSVSPIKIDGVTTFGELETLEFLRQVEKEPQRYVLVDSRIKSWFATGTIAKAVNLEYIHFLQTAKYKKEFEKDLEMLGVKIVDGKYDFSNAKTALFFCNGIWCGQSPQAIAALIKLGYPKDKMFWYRGGMQDWRSVGFSDYKYPQSR